MNNIKVIGIGNKIMGDDGIGVAVAEVIKEKIICNSIEVIIGETDYRYCLSKVSQGDYVIVIDAVNNGDEIGTINKCLLQEAILHKQNSYFQHEMDFFEALLLFNTDIDGELIGIEVGEVNFNLGLSHQLASKLKDICVVIERYIREKL